MENKGILEMRTYLLKATDIYNFHLLFLKKMKCVWDSFIFFSYIAQHVSVFCNLHKVFNISLILKVTFKQEYYF